MYTLKQSFKAQFVAIKFCASSMSAMIFPIAYV